jgi:hypothetical protein
MTSVCGKGEAKKLSRALQRPGQGIPKTFPRQGPFFLASRVLRVICARDARVS